jgi:hypothetical protein
VPDWVDSPALVAAHQQLHRETPLRETLLRERFFIEITPVSPIQ